MRGEVAFVSPARAKKKYKTTAETAKKKEDVQTMLQSIIVVAQPVISLFLMMAVGFVLEKKGHLSENLAGKLSFILLYVGAPCVLVDSLQKLEGGAATIPVIWAGIGLCCLYFLVAITASRFFWRKADPDKRDALRFGCVFPNCSFMGLPLMLSIYGPYGAIYAVPIIAVFNVLQWTYGVAMMGGRDQVNLKKAILNPGTLSVAVGLGLFMLEWTLPAPIGMTVSYLGGINTPLAMLIIGAQMARTDLFSTFRRKDLYFVSLLKLFVFPALFTLAALPFGAEKSLMVALVLMTACPVAGVTGILAQLYNRDASSAAQSVSLTTLLSLLTLPLIAAVMAQI